MRGRILPSRRALAEEVRVLRKERGSLLTVDEAKAAARYVTTLALVHAQDRSTEALTPTIVQASHDASLGSSGFIVVVDAWRSLTGERSTLPLFRAALEDVLKGVPS